MPWTAGRRSSVPPASTEDWHQRHIKRPGGRTKPRLAEQLAFDVGAADGHVGRLRNEVRASAKNEPGVYLMRSAHGEVLYVGKSTKLRTRLLSYFRLPWPAHRHARLLRETARIEWEVQPSDFAALWREVRLIRTHLPRYNVRGARPLDRWWVITIASGPAPRLRIQRAAAAARSRTPAQLIGPFAARRPLVEALRVLNDTLGLRDCPERIPMHVADDPELFDTAHPALQRTPGCHRFETRRCLGPCVGAPSASEYRTQLVRARAVLEGRDDTPHQQLVRDMSAASAAMAFERAGWLRDRLAALQALEEQLQRIRAGLARPSLVLAVPGRHGDDRLYLLRQGRVIGEARVADPEAVHALATLEGLPTHTPSGTTVDQFEELLMLEQWLRAHPETVTTETVAEAVARLTTARAGPGSAAPAE